jgi:hypothetical protein
MQAFCQFKNSGQDVKLVLITEVLDGTKDMFDDWW